jgi:hypothetical protein
MGETSPVEFFDDFNGESDHWNYRTDNYASISQEKSILRLCSGPTEALYYSNAELSDGLFDDLPWVEKTFEAKLRMTGIHYGSAGWGFWNHTMQFDKNMCMWFIHLQSRGPYMFQGFFAQVGKHLYPIKVYRGNIALLSYASRLTLGKLGVLIHSAKPSLQTLDLTEWHIYKVEWRKTGVNFHIDGNLVARLPPPAQGTKARADIWIDNAVFGYNPRDAGRVYRHLTQENRNTTCIEVDYVKIY